MGHLFEFLQLGAALICSGVFWATFLFLVNACALNRHVPFLGVGAAVGVLSVTARLFAQVVTGHGPLALFR